MNIFKKVAAALTAVALLAGISVPVSAADSTLKLLTEEVDSEVAKLSVDGLFCTVNDAGDGVGNFISIPQSSLEKWRSGSELQMTDVEVDGSINWNRLRFYNDVPELHNIDSSANVTKRYAYSFDGKDTMKIVSASNDWIYPTTNGDIIQRAVCDKNGNLTFSARTSTGKTVKAKFKVGENPYNGERWYQYNALNDSKYLGYVVYQTTDEPSVSKSSQNLSFEITIAIDLVDKNGKTKNVWKKRTTDLTYYGTAGNNFLFLYRNLSNNGVYNTCMYDLKKGKVVTYAANTLSYNFDIAFVKSDGTKVSSTGTYDLDYFDGNYSNVSIAVYNLSQGDGEKTLYCLADLSSGMGKIISDNYKSISTKDGKMFLVKTYDDKWGYINAKGKFLGAFDDAAEFWGDYAPVIKNGKAYLIDKNLKCVSEKIDATSVRTLGDGLYYAENGSRKYLVTYASGSAAVTKPADTQSSASKTDISKLEFYKLNNEEYTGKKICPDPSIYDNNELLEEKTDYTLSYKNNIKLGTGMVIVKGCGNYTGTKTLKFNIVLKKCSLSAKKNSNGKATLSWKKSPGAVSYEIYYAVGNSSFKKLASVSGTALSKTITNLDLKNNSYKFRVRACAKNSAGKNVYSSWSRTVALG